MKRSKIARALLIVALLLALGGSATWLTTGAHRGWSQTSVPTMQVDDVTGIATPVYENRFVAGVDFLGATLLGAGVLAISSFLIRKSKTKISST